MTTATREDVLNAQSEAEFQRHVIAWAKHTNWKITSMKDSRSLWWGTDKGFPDLFMVRGKRIIAAELKVKRNSLSSEQMAWMWALHDAGIEHYVWRSVDEAIIKAVLA